ncbi:MAG: hypothetical protein H6Q89_5731 [Myxococcaceae bacterium]|nr:hypothetical protein [Myxococcaceae bacterium]
MLRRVLARIRPWLKLPRTMVITRVGRTYLVITMGVGLGALNTGNNLLYLVLGFLLSLIVASGVLSERSLRHLRIRRLLPDVASAGQPFALRYQVRRTSGRSFALELSEENRLVSGGVWIPWVAQEDVIARADCVVPKRGPVRLVGLRVTTTFPLGLFAKTRVLEVEDQLLIYPRRGFVCADPPEREGLLAGDGGNPRRRDGTGDVLGLRELAPGEDGRRIHWLKSAAAGKLLKVEREREETQQFVLEVNAELQGEELETRVEEAAALSQRLLQRGHEVGLHAGKAQVRPAGGPGQERRLLAALAWVGFDEEAP